MDQLTQIKMRLQGLSNEVAAAAKLLAIAQEFQQVSFEMAKLLDAQEAELVKHRADKAVKPPGRGGDKPQTRQT